MQPSANHRVIRERDIQRVKELMLVVVTSCVVLAPLLIYVWQNSEWIQAGYRLEKLKGQRDRLVEQNHQLRLEKASLSNLARVEQVATDQLGLASPPAGTVVLVDMKSVKPAARQAAAVASAAFIGKGGPRDATTDSSRQ